MSTRANIIIADEYDSLIFYRHFDGYPEETMPTLERFLNLVKEGKLRDNVSQASGWLILIGADEYKTDLTSAEYGWKVGAYEPTTRLHGDIEHLYVIDLVEKKIHVDNYDHPALKKWENS